MQTVEEFHTWARHRLDRATPLDAIAALMVDNVAEGYAPDRPSQPAWIIRGATAWVFSEKINPGADLANATPEEIRELQILAVKVGRKLRDQEPTAFSFNTALHEVIREHGESNARSNPDDGVTFGPTSQC